MLQKKDVKLNNLKYFTDLLFVKKGPIPEKLEKNEEFSNFKFRIINLLVNYPKLLWYINKNFNNFYQHSNIDWVESFKLLMELYGIKSKSELTYTKFKVSDRKVFKNILTETHSNLCQNDLNELYRLYAASIISANDLQKLKNSYSDRANNLKKNFINEVVEKPQVEVKCYKHTFNESAFALLKTKRKCKNCKFNASEKLFIDGNTNNLDDVNILFINDVSSSSDISQGNIFFGNDFKEQFTKLKINYLIVNVLPCDIKSVDDNKLFKLVSEDCRDLTSMLINNIKCNNKILIGQRVKNWFGYKTKLSNIKVEDYFLLTSPKENEEAFKTGFSIIIKDVLKSITKINNYENNITKEDSTLTLFDIKIINDKILYIFCDKDGKKQYSVDKIQYPVYIKTGKYDDCEYITGDMDYEIKISNVEKRKISLIMYEKINSEVIKNVVNNQ
ncbi:MAG: hypothetical protein IPH62_19420 [Ignavibacteriae bacterium]|nr:hypothetical protein [Ignavibacteriota bacterium]